MIALLSPAKTLDLTKLNLNIETSKPIFISEAEVIMNNLKELEIQDLCPLMKISEDLGVQTFTKIQEFTMVMKNPLYYLLKGKPIEG